MGVDNSSVRWKRSEVFSAGVYRFTVTADDGVRLYIDGQLKIDKWLFQAPTTYTAEVFLSGGEHQIRLEYFEGGGGAVAQLSWETLAGSECYADVVSDHWKGEYYGNTNLTGNPLMIRDDGAPFLNFDIGPGSPGAACGLGADNFSTRWTRWVNFTIGLYRFTVTGDDGVRLYIDGQLKIDKWLNQAPTTYTAEGRLTGGEQQIRLEYIEGGGGAVAQFAGEALAGAECYADVVAGEEEES